MSEQEQRGVSKAVIPAAGRGTRMHPISHLLPKELIPLGSRPVLGLILAEAMAAGLREIALVVRDGKDAIRAYVDLLASEGGLPGVEVSFIDQKEPSGLADAISLCRDFSAGEPFALLLPDNVLLSPDYRLTRMVELFQETGKDVLGVIEVRSQQADHFGNSGRFEARTLRPGVFELSLLLDKKSGPLEIAEGGTIQRTCGRCVCHPRLFEVIEACRRGARGEYSEVPAFQHIIREYGAMGCLLPGPLFDVGNPRGYLAASAFLYARFAAMNGN